MKRGALRFAASAQMGRALTVAAPPRPSGRLPQTQAKPDPARAGEHEVNAEKDSEHVERGDRPMDQDDDSEQQRDQARSDDPAPRRPALHVEPEENPHDARRDQRRAKNEG